MWHFHEWSDWENVESGNLAKVESGATVGYYVIQKRDCIKCKKREITIQRCTIDRGKIGPTGWYS